MIAVIADDFTGAAELGGVGIRHGYHVVIDTKVNCNISADILIIATDTRSLDAECGAAEVGKITRELLALNPDFIYKKVDSILRGNVGEELIAQMRACSRNRALVIPANPALQRTIREGIYYYNTKPLHEYNFTDRGRKRNSSQVMDLLGSSVKTHASVVSTDDELPVKGLLIGNTEHVSDLDNWVQKIDAQTIPSGGSGFFDAILRARNDRRMVEHRPVQLGQKILYICGSAFAGSRKAVSDAEFSGQKVVYMPEKLLYNEDADAALLADWENQVMQAITEGSRVIVAIGKIHSEHTEDLPRRVRRAVADLVDSILREAKIDELIIEGGATAHAIIQKQKFSKFYPVNELAPGTIRMKVEENENLFLTLKPGSYLWPDSIWQY
jgi:uncharacterized protein YgbK (DUF1537 family)